MLLLHLLSEMSRNYSLVADSNFDWLAAAEIAAGAAETAAEAVEIAVEAAEIAAAVAAAGVG